jgi:hypothetical protein
LSALLPFARNLGGTVARAEVRRVSPHVLRLHYLRRPALSSGLRSGAAAEGSPDERRPGC